MSGSVNLLLTEIERHNGLIIMATNRAFDLDEAMHRRITLAVEFKVTFTFVHIWNLSIQSNEKGRGGEREIKKPKKGRISRNRETRINAAIRK